MVNTYICTYPRQVIRMCCVALVRPCAHARIYTGRDAQEVGLRVCNTPKLHGTWQERLRREADMQTQILSMVQTVFSSLSSAVAAQVPK